MGKYLQGVPNNVPYINTCLVPYLLAIFCLDKYFNYSDVDVGTAAAQEPDSLQLSVPRFSQVGALAVESIEHSVQREDLLHGLLGRLFKPASVDQVDEAARHDVLAGKIELKMYSSCSMKCTLCTICGNSFQFQLKQSYMKKYFICTKCEKMFILLAHSFPFFYFNHSCMKQYFIYFTCTKCGKPYTSTPLLQ